jgi:hypothetical protein
MKALRCLLLILLAAFINCTHVPVPGEEKDSIYDPVAASLFNINQKVASHFLISGVPDGFNEAQYKAAVEAVCYPNPVCKSQAQEIFRSYGVSARKIDDIFSVMLCDKEMTWKVMEDFSCDNTRTEVKSWRQGDGVRCDFEENWQRIKQEYCK